MSLSIHRNLEFRKLKIFFDNCEFVIWKLEKVKKRKNEEYFLKYLDNLDFQDEKIELWAAPNTGHYFQIELFWKYFQRLSHWRCFFRASFFDNNFFAIIAMSVYLFFWIFLALAALKMVLWVAWWDYSFLLIESEFLTTKGFMAVHLNLMIF